MSSSRNGRIAEVNSGSLAKQFCLRSKARAARPAADCGLPTTDHAPEGGGLVTKRRSNHPSMNPKPHLVAQLRVLTRACRAISCYRYPHDQRTRPRLDRQLHLGHCRRCAPRRLRPRQVPRRDPPDDRAAPAVVPATVAEGVSEIMIDQLIDRNPAFWAERPSLRAREAPCES